MNHNTLQSKTIAHRQSITVKKTLTLQEYKDIVYLTKSYHTAMEKNQELPAQPLPELSVLLEAALIVDAYMKALNAGLSIKLYNSVLDADTICAVYFFSKEKTLNLKIGNYQMFVIKHK